MIYIHIPFCRSFCTYCGFYSELASKCRRAEDAGKQEELFGKYAEAVAAEAVWRSSEMNADVNTLYIGGGTPSVLPLSALRHMVESLPSGTFEEFTVEVNPEDIVEKGYAYVEGLLDMGVNRVSMGVQSFDDAVLRFMNRRHDSAAARQAYNILEEAGVKNISIDLIFGLPQLSDALWQDTLDKALNISSRGVPPQHISSYQLSVEPGSALAGLVGRGEWSEASDELCERQYTMLCAVLREAGYNHYEISNFAQPGHEAVHNSAYWRHVPYVGLGPGAHSYMVQDSPIRKWSTEDVHGYILAAESGDFVQMTGYESLTPEQMSIEHIMLGLRTSRGVESSFLHSHCDAEALQRALAAGNLVEVSSGETGAVPFIRIPESRFFISDSIIADII